MSGRRKSSIVPPKDQNRRTLPQPMSVQPKDSTRRRVEKIEANRGERRRAIQIRKKERADEEKRNIAAGNPGDVDFIGMVRKWREEHAPNARPFGVDAHPRICICVRKRPISDKERAKNDHDSVTCINPAVWTHSAKLRVDGITKYLDHASFHFDYSFGEDVPTSEVYTHTAMPLLDFVCNGTSGRATVFAYGQTGSGKTYTMSGIQELITADLFLQLEEQGGCLKRCSIEDTIVKISFFEMYGGFVQDLLNDRHRLKVLEDGKGEINVTGLLELEADDPQTLLTLIEAGNKARTTHATEANDESSRSHAICQIMLRDRDTDELKGKLSLVDLAGSERGTDTKSHSSLRRTESADINTSLLALKECIRALDMNKKGAQHVPYRQSKLTLILKDCFTSESAMTAMIATVSPGASACDHSLNTLRYADRIKGKKASDICVERRSPTRPNGSTSPSRGSLIDRLGEFTTKSQINESQVHHTSRIVDGGTTGYDREIDDPYETKNECDDVENYFDAVSESDSFSSLLDSKTGTTSIEPANYNQQRQEALFEQEEAILNMHMSNIHENAELLSQEGNMLKIVQKGDVTDEEIAEYVAFLESTLDQKEDMISKLQRSIDLYQLKHG